MKKIIRFLILSVVVLAFMQPKTLPVQAGKLIGKKAHNDLPPPAAFKDQPAASVDDDWTIECVDCPKLFGQMTNRNMHLDAAGHAHIAYGEDHLYYTWYDGSAWHYKIVDDTPRSGSFASLALDDDGTIHISYVSESIGDNMALKYATLTAGGWNIQTVHQGEYDVIRAAIDVDRNGYPHISYMTKSYGIDGYVVSLRYAYKGENGWQHETVATDLTDIHNPSITIDTDGHVHISYENVGSLIYTFNNGSSWDFYTVDPHGAKPSMVLDSNGYAHIAYFDIDMSLMEIIELRYAHQDQTGWYTETVSIDCSFVWGSTVSLALDLTDQPYMSVNEHPYRDNSLVLVNRPSGAWETQIVDTEAGISSIDIDPQGRPHISYISYQQGYYLQELKYATLDNFGWQLQVVDNQGFVQGNAPLALDNLGRANLSYWKGIKGIIGLNFANLNETGWNIQSVPPNGVPYSSLVLDTNNTPHIFTGATLFYLDNTTWISDTVECLEEDYDQQSSLVLDRMGDPHVVVTSEVCGKYECGYGVLQYAYRHAGSWTCENIGSDKGEGPSLTLNQDGWPYVSYSGSGLNLAIRDVSGWTIEQIDVQVMGTTSLVLDTDGYAHISYYNGITKDLKYAVQDSGGWIIDFVDTNGDVGIFNSIVLDQDGKPHISYYKDNGFHEGELMYAVLDQDEWVKTSIDPLTGGPNSIALDTFDHPRISYVDEINEDLKYAYISPPTYAVTIIPSQNWGYGQIGTLISYRLQIANVGMITDTYKISVGDNLWTIENPPETGQLIPYQSTRVDIHVTIPPTATLGSSDTATITLTSQSDPSVSATATLTTYAAITTYLPLVAR